MDDLNLEVANTHHDGPDDHKKPPKRPVEGPHASHLSPGGWVIIACCFLAIMCSVVVLVTPQVRDLAGGVFASRTPTPMNTNPTVVTEQTSTAVAQGWLTLQRRPLQLPTLAPGSPCPSAIARQVDPALGPGLGSGLAYAVGGGPTNVVRFAPPVQAGSGSGEWGIAKVLWYVPPPYIGPVLVRGHQIDGPHDLRFQGGVEWLHYTGDYTTSPLLAELQLLGGSQYGTPAATWPSYSRIQVPGCYAYQIDGLTFSEVIIFQAYFHP